MKKYSIGIDIGGSHIAASLVDAQGVRLPNGLWHEVAIDARGSAHSVVQALQTVVRAAVAETGTAGVYGVGLAMPGPFDYPRGISQVAGVQKFDSIFGLNLRQVVADALRGVHLPVVFENDATCFALGEYYAGAAQGSQRAIVLTLGTGFGSTFMVQGQVQRQQGVGVPPQGYLYHVPFGQGIADDYFSTRWFVQRWEQQTGTRVQGVKDIAQLATEGNIQAQELFAEFAHNLTECLAPWVQAFAPDVLVLGGSIAKAAPLFMDTLSDQLQQRCAAGVRVAQCQLWGQAPLVGAAMNMIVTINDIDMQQDKDRQIRKTQQYLAPTKATVTTPGHYDIYPAFPLGEGKVRQGADALAQWIAAQQQVVIDGYVGVLWDDLIQALATSDALKGKTVRWYHADAALKPADELNRMVQPYMGEQGSIFGTMTKLQLQHWFDMERLRSITPDPAADINILVGCGAALAGWDSAKLVYVDVPKNELQFRMRAGAAANLGVLPTPGADTREVYKRFYFVDWPVLNAHKCQLYPRMDLVVDEQRPHDLLMVSGNDLRQGLQRMSRNFFRVRPWFEPGAWGGTWMKEHIQGLNPEVDNLAWSFELMVLENGLMLESDGYRLEVSFDFLMYAQHKAVLGDCAARFGYDFPIRFDFLDTFDGGNLSVQCHPRPSYIKDQFGMPFTQDETYYIMDCQGEPVVYLGFQEGIDPSAFHQALLHSEQHAQPIPIEQYVQKHKAGKHDFFLIPNGTVHASGKDNLVLEISSSPYIFTFKMYDWVRLDLDGRPRPINIEHGMRNLYFERQGKVVQEQLICKPYVLSQDAHCTIEHMPTHPEHFYDVHRYALVDQVQVQTMGTCHVWMLVEGQAVMIETADGMSQRFNYAETFVIPAAAGSYKVTNLGQTRALLVKAFVK